MVNKLKWAFDQKSWSLALKGLVLGGLWYGAPWWVFLAAAVLFYMNPLIRFGKMLPLFLIAVGATFLLPHGLLEAVYVAVLYWMIFGIKELWVVDRKQTTTSVALLSFLPYLFNLFDSAPSWQEAHVWWVLAATAVVYGILSALVYRQFRLPNNDSAEFPEHTVPVLVGISALLSWQLGLMMLVLPLYFLFQVTLLFVWCAVMLLLGRSYLAGLLSRQSVFVHFAFAGTVTILILATLP